MEIVNLNFPFPKHIPLLFLEMFRDKMVIDIIRIIWYYYENTELYFIKDFEIGANNKLDIILDNKYVFKLDDAMLSFCRWGNVYRNKVRFILGIKTNNDAMDIFYRHIDNYFTTKEFMHNVCSNDDIKCVYIKSRYFSIKKMNHELYNYHKKIIDKNNDIYTYSANITFTINNMTIRYTNGKCQYAPIFELLTMDLL